MAELLEAHVPRPGEEDLRDFAWHYRWRPLHDPPAFRQENPIRGSALAPGGDVVTYDGSLLCFWDKITRRETGRRRLAALPSPRCWQFSPEGTLLALGTADGSVYLYDTTTGHERLFFQGAAPLKDLCFSAAGRKLATIHMNRQARAWEVATGKDVAAFALRLPAGANAWSHTELYYRDFSLSPDGQALALACHPDHAQVALYRAGRAGPESLQAESVTVTCVAFAPGGRTIASGDQNNRVGLWDAATGRHRDNFGPGMGDVTRLAFSADSTLLGAGSLMGPVSVWDQARRQRRFLFKGHTAAIIDLAFSADGQSLVATSRDGTARLWQLTLAQEPRTLVRAPPSVSFRVADSPDGRWFAATGPLALWGARTGVVVRRLGSADSVAFSTDGKALASGSSDRRRPRCPTGTR